MRLLTVSILVSLSLLVNLNNAYYLAWHGLEWNNASIWCQSYCNSHLASVHSPLDYINMIDLIDNVYPYIYTRTWIGLNDIDKTDVWVWSDGTPFDFGNVKATNSHLIVRGTYPWRSNEPDYNDTIDTCVAIETGSNYPTSNSKRWVDRRITANYQFFCNGCSSKLHKYAAVNGDRNQSRAQQICENVFGTSLASIHSDSDMIEARTTCKQITTSNGCWIGLSDQSAGLQDFTWNDGTEWDYGRTLHVYPWFQSEPGASTDQHCIFLDPDNGADPGEYLWDDFWCHRESPKALCNAPSEICMDQHWFIPNGNPTDWVFSKRPCELKKTKMEKESVAILGDKQYINTAGTLLVDMMYTINTVGKNGNAGLAFYLDQTTCKDWFYIGIWADFNIIFIGKSINGIWNLLEYKSLTHEGIRYEKGTYYNLGIEVSGGTSWTVKLNDIAMLSTTDPDLTSLTSNAGNTRSGFVGIREVNATFTVKSLFISGEVEYYINNEWYMACTQAPTLSPTLETISPSLAPTTDPSVSPSVDPTTSPSMEPTKSPTNYPTIITMQPSSSPSFTPTISPSYFPSVSPSNDPTLEPTLTPTGNPTTEPTNDPTIEPTVPSRQPTVNPTIEPTGDPTEVPSIYPSSYPTFDPTKVPSSYPTIEPTYHPTYDPTQTPTNIPTADPTSDPSHDPSSDPTIDPTYDPTYDPTNLPSIQPTMQPTFEPSVNPSFIPTNAPSIEPTDAPTVEPTKVPSYEPTSFISVIEGPGGNSAGTGNQGRTQLIWVVGIPISIALMCGFFVFMYKTWKEEEEKEKAREQDDKLAMEANKSPKGSFSFGYAKAKASIGSPRSHVRSPSHSLDETDDDVMDEIEMGVTVTGADPLDTDADDQVELEINDDNDGINNNVATTNIDDAEDDTKDEELAETNHNHQGTELEEVLEEVTMVPTADGTMVPDTNHTHAEEDGESLSGDSATPNLTTPLKTLNSE